MQVELLVDLSCLTQPSGAAVLQPLKCLLVSISLWDGEEGANMERFGGSVSLLPHLCPLRVP